MTYDIGIIIAIPNGMFNRKIQNCVTNNLSLKKYFVAFGYSRHEIKSIPSAIFINQATERNAHFTSTVD